MDSKQTSSKEPEFPQNQAPPCKFARTWENLESNWDYKIKIGLLF
jgi:hypothetical protein